MARFQGSLRAAMLWVAVVGANFAALLAHSCSERICAPGGADRFSSLQVAVWFAVRGPARRFRWFFIGFGVRGRLGGSLWVGVSLPGIRHPGNLAVRVSPLGHRPGF